MLPKISEVEVRRILVEGTQGERLALTELLADYDKILSDNPLEGFEPYPKQADFLAARERTKGFMGGNRAGKTEIGIVDDVLQAIEPQAVPQHLQDFKFWEPPFFCRIVAPSFTENLQGVIFPKLRALVPKGELKGGSWDKAFDKQNRMLHFRNGSWFQFLTSEQDVDKHAGAALHRVHFDEEPPGEHGEQIYRENRMRLVDHGGQLTLTMTPEWGMGWSYDEIWERRHTPNVFCVSASSLDNPFIPSEEIELALEGATKEEWERRVEGRFVHFKGLVYREFGDHVVDPPEREHIREQDVVVGIDPGARWMGIVWIAFDQDNDAVVFDEVFLEQPHAPVQDAVAAIRAKNKEWGVKPDYVIDPSARNRSLTTGEGVEGGFLREGIYTAHGQNDVEAGVLEVKRRLQGRGLLISTDCQRLLWEIPRYRMDDKADKFAVVKEHDHELDAMRYALMSRPWWQRPEPKHAPNRGFQPTFSDKEWRYKPAPSRTALPMGTFT